MPEPVAAAKPTRTDRRRERTRARLIAAARDLFAEQGVGATGTGEISERADVAAGSFYNHFTDKNDLVEVVIAEFTEEQGALVDERTQAIDDPADIVAYAHRHFVRLAAEDPHLARLLIRLDASHRMMDSALGPRALRDIERGLDAGRFEFESAEAAAAIAGGALLGTMQAVADGALGEDADVFHAAGVLRILGLGAADAEASARRALG
jgi:AcrR family transcriptional regulator